MTRIWAKRGTRPRAPRDQRRIWAYILGAVCPARRATSALVMPYLNAATVSAHLADVSTEVAEDAHAVVVLDGAGFHIAKDLAIPHNITPMRLPAYSPELNPIENVWEYLRGNQLSNTVYESYDEIVTACSDAWNFFAQDPERVATITTRSWATVNV